MTPEPLPIDMEKYLTHLLTSWANEKRLSAANANEILEAIQENDAWEQSFWTRMSTVLIPALAVVEHVPSNPWSVTLPSSAKLTNMASSLHRFDAPSSCSYLYLSI